MANEEQVEMQYTAVEEVINTEADKLLESLPAKQAAPEDFLAAFIERHLASVKGLINDMGKNALKRIILNIMAGEFSKREYTPVTEEERKVAFHFNECVNQRAMLVFNEELKKVEVAIAKEQADLKKIDELTQAELSDGAKQMLAEAGEKVEIHGK